MIKIKTRLRKWGNSLGVVVPKSLNNLRENEEVTILIKVHSPNLKKLFGAHKFKKPTNKILNEVDKELYNEG